MCHGRIRVAEPILARRDDIWVGLAAEQNTAKRGACGKSWRHEQASHVGRMQRCLVWLEQSAEPWGKGWRRGDRGVRESRLRSAFPEHCGVMREPFWTNWPCGTCSLSGRRWPGSSWSSGTSVWRQRFRSQHYIDESWGVFPRERRENTLSTELTAEPWGVAQPRKWTKVQQTREGTRSSTLEGRREPGGQRLGRAGNSRQGSAGLGQQGVEEIAKILYILSHLHLSAPTLSEDPRMTQSRPGSTAALNHCVKCCIENLTTFFMLTSCNSWMK